jgi:hypothetical protein
MSKHPAVCLAVVPAARLAFSNETPANRPKTAKTGLFPEMQGQMQGKYIANAR